MIKILLVLASPFFKKIYSFYFSEIQKARLDRQYARLHPSRTPLTVIFVLVLAPSTIVPRDTHPPLTVSLTLTPTDPGLAISQGDTHSPHTPVSTTLRSSFPAFILIHFRQ